MSLSSDRESGVALNLSTALSPIRWFQALLAHRLGVGLVEQEQTVRAMLGQAPSEAATYWLQLILSMCIATFGLVLNSSGVVIGAMLIAPLMGPIHFCLLKLDTPTRTHPKPCLDEIVIRPRKVSC